MPDRKRRARAGQVVASVVALSVMTGCLDAFDRKPTATPEPAIGVVAGAAAEGRFDAVNVPDQLSTDNPGFIAKGILGSQGTLPNFIAALRFEATGATSIAGWTSADGLGWNEVSVPDGKAKPAESSNPTDGLDESSTGEITVASDGGRTVIAASTVSGGHRRQLVAFESKDRTNWTTLAIPALANERGLVPQAVIVDGARTIIFGVDGGYTPTALILDDEGKLIRLPESEAGDEFGQFDGAALGDGTIVAVGRAQTPGDDPGPVSFRSMDGGLTWEGPSEDFGTGRGFTSGVVFTDGSWIATGAASSDNRWTPAAWISRDGASWAEETVGNPSEHEYRFSDEGDTYFTAPSGHGGTVAAALVNGSSRASGVMTRRGGAWELAGGTEYWVARDVTAGAAVGEQGIVVARYARSLLNVGLIRDGRWTGGPTYGTERGRLKVDAVSSIFAGETSVIAAQELIEYEGPEDPGWAVFDEPFLLVQRGEEALEASEISPPAANQLESIITIVDPDSGAQLIAGNDFRPYETGLDNSDMFTWHRDSGADAWAEGTGLIGSQTEMILGGRRLAKMWVLTGIDRESAQYNSYGKAAVWTSPDGITWGRAEGPFETDGVMKTAANDACDLPNGRLLVVGKMQRGTSGWSPLAWVRESDGSWQQLPSDAFGDAAGELVSCVSSDAGVVVQGALGGRSMLWKTSDASEFEQVRIGERGEEYGHLISLSEGGYAAPGFISRGSRYGAVVWMSRDGENWFEIDLPTTGPLVDGQVSDRGDAVVVAAGGAHGFKIWMLTNPYEILN